MTGMNRIIRSEQREGARPDISILGRSVPVEFKFAEIEKT